MRPPVVDDPDTDAVDAPSFSGDFNSDSSAVKSTKSGAEAGTVHATSTGVRPPGAARTARVHCATSRPASSARRNRTLTSRAAAPQFATCVRSCAVSPTR